jgi:hypothetical protein
MAALLQTALAQLSRVAFDAQCPARLAARVWGFSDVKLAFKASQAAGSRGDRHIAAGAFGL